ncbi:MAG: hypothetical protein KJI69_06515 [Patescibacteria group bacterium]|nr:hypothetical protein [Patescibacteria group bacterium]
MKISALRILELNKKHNLLENLAERELNNPEGSGIDLRVGEVYRIAGDSLLSADETGGKRHSPETELIGDVKKNGHKRITIHPGEYLLVKTMESINAPDHKIKYGGFFSRKRYLIPKISPRSSLQKGGVGLLRTRTDPGWYGPLTFGLNNKGNQDFHFELGARMFSVEYEPVIGEIKRAYSGQHQGGRVTSQGKTEKQN